MENTETIIHMINDIKLCEYLPETRVDNLIDLLDDMEKSIQRQMTEVETDLLKSAKINGLFSGL